MENNFDTVAEEMFSPETPADDAQAAVTAEELMRNLTGEESQTVENDGDDAQTSSKAEQTEQSKDDKISRRIKAALASQKKQFYADLGGSEEEIREILRAARAQKLSQDNPKISPEAAKMIVEEREKARAAQPVHSGANAEIVSAINSLIEDGWTREMLQAFVQDETVREQINEEGVSVRKAATSYLMRAGSSQTARKKSVPTMRTATAAGTLDANRIEEMTDEEFAEFSRRAKAAAAEGRKVRL